MLAVKYFFHTFATPNGFLTCREFFKKLKIPTKSADVAQLARAADL